MVPGGSFIKKAVILSVYTILILVSVPHVWRIEVFLRSRNLLMITVYLILAVYITVLLVVMVRYAEHRLRAFIILALYTAVYAGVVLYVRGFDKKIHFIEYGILAYLVHDLVRAWLPGRGGYLLSFIAVSAVGLIDEMLQTLVPQRSFDAGDIASNIIAAVLMLLLMWIMRLYPTKDRPPEHAVSPPSCRPPG